MKPLSAVRLAKAIELAANASLRGSFSMEEHGEVNRALWDIANYEGVATAVEEILQALSKREMDEAIKATFEKKKEQTP